MRAALGVLVVASVCYVALASSAVWTTTVQYDEFTDLVIAASLADNPLRGHGWDASQARLPMYATAVVYRILRRFDSELGPLDVLPVGRWISLAVCVLAIWGTALLGYRLFDRATGLIAATLFAFSPYVLHFGSDALTQGDAFTPALVIFALLAFERFLRRGTILWLVCLSCSLGFAIAAKFTMVLSQL